MEKPKNLYVQTMDMSCGGGRCWWERSAGWRVIKGRRKWDNCNSIINKIHLKNNHMVVQDSGVARSQHQTESRKLWEAVELIYISVLVVVTQLHVFVNTEKCELYSM